MGHRSFFPGLILDKIVVGIANNREPGICCAPDNFVTSWSQQLRDFMRILSAPMKSHRIRQDVSIPHDILWPTNRFQHPNVEHVLLTPINSHGPSWTARLTWTPMEFGPWARCTESSRRWLSASWYRWGHTPYISIPMGPSPLPWFFSMAQSILIIFRPRFLGIWWGSIWAGAQTLSSSSRHRHHFFHGSWTPSGGFLWFLVRLERREMPQDENVVVRLRSSFMSRPLRGGRLTTDILWYTDGYYENILAKCGMN